MDVSFDDGWTFYKHRFRNKFKQVHVYIEIYSKWESIWYLWAKGENFETLETWEPAQAKNILLTINIDNLTYFMIVVSEIYLIKIYQNKLFFCCFTWIDTAYCFVGLPFCWEYL